MTRAECERLGIFSDRELAEFGEPPSSIRFIRDNAVRLVDIPGTCDQYVVMSRETNDHLVGRAMNTMHARAESENPTPLVETPPEKL